MWVQSLSREDLKQETANCSAPEFLPGKSHGQRSLAGYSPWVTKELDTTKKQQHKLSQTTGESSLFCKSTLIGCLSYT